MGEDSKPAATAMEHRAAPRWDDSSQPCGGPFETRTRPGRGRRISKLVIEVAANEDDITKEDNPNTPLTVEELAEDAAACTRAGASIYHFHNRQPNTAENLFDDPVTFLRTAELIRAKSDIIFCPSYNLRPDAPLKPQFEYLREFVVDPRLKPEVLGVVPVHEKGISTHYDPRNKSFHNPKTRTMEFLELLRELKIKPLWEIYEVGHLFEALAYLDYGLLEEPLDVTVFVSELALSGIPGTLTGITQWDSLMDDRFNWQTGFAVYGPSGSEDKDAISRQAVALGNHIRTGIGDLNRNGFYVVRDLDGPDRTVTNVDLVKKVAAWGREVGRGVATPAEAREIMGLAPLPAASG